MESITNINDDKPEITAGNKERTRGWNLQPYQYKPGQCGNPSGRPKGKSLKEYTREMLAAMTNEERQNYLKGLPKEVIWKMSEGNPDQSNKHEVSLPDNLIGLIKYGHSKEGGDNTIPGENKE